MSDQIGHLLKESKGKNFQAFARLLTVIERVGAACLRHPELLEPRTMALRVGITGPPGAGKSTLIGRIIAEARQQNLRVGVLAVDPSSAISRGAILADRIRYSEHFADEGVFIRSLGTRGSLGGLSAATYLMVRAFDACDFDVVLIETVGVGQTELEVMHVADTVAVTLVPESGDGIQAMKAGLLEIADLFVVNKADRPGASGLVNELRASIALDPSGPSIDVVQTVATENIGVQALCQILLADLQRRSFEARRVTAARLQAEAKALLFSRLLERAERSVDALQTPADLFQLLSK